MNILVAADDSSESRATARLLAHLHFPKRSNLFLLSVTEPTVSASTLTPDDRRRFRGTLKLAQDVVTQRATDFVTNLAETYWHPELKIIPLVKKGVPGGQILDTIEEHDIHLAVLGSHGRTRREQFLLGSVSEWVLGDAPCSVLIVKEQQSKPTSRPSGMNVLVGVDGSEDAKTALKFLKQIRFPASTTLTLCAVIAEHMVLTTELAARAGKAGFREMKQFASTVREAQKQKATAMLEDYATGLNPGDWKVGIKVLHGHPADQLITLAQQRYDLVVVGSRGLTGLRKVFLGSVSNKIACHAPCSVLVVRKSSKQETTTLRKAL